MNKITVLILLIAGLWMTEAYAQQTDQASSPDAEHAESVQSEVYVFPVIKPEFTLTGGYRYVHVNGSSSAEEFEYLHDSFVLGGELRTVSLNHRLHLDFDIKNGKDYYGDLSYAYKDLILFRGVNATLFHNLDHAVLFTFDNPSTSVNPDYPVLDRHPDAVYGREVGITDVFLRIKAPDYPAHLYIDGYFVNKDSIVQQMFYQQASPSVRTSEKRNIDLNTSVYTVGANSHLGPVEADFSHSEKRFDVAGDGVLVDKIGAGSGRTEGDYYHSLIPELKSSTNTLKLHTSFTGGLVASATLSKTDKENRDSGAKADYLFVSGDVTWMPITKLNFFLKYRHQERDIDNPDSVTVQNLSDLSKYSYTVRNSISSISDAVTGTVRYRPLKGIMLKTGYTYEDIRRNDVKDWYSVPDSTQRQKFFLSGDIRIMSGVKLSAKYTHKDINDPATNIEPDHSDEGQLTLSWIPLPSLNAYISYAIKEEKRDSVDFVNYDTHEVEHADNRKANDDRIIGSISYILKRNLSATVSYAYIHNKVRQDIRLSPDENQYWDTNVPYKTTAHNYSLDLRYSPINFINLNGGISHTISRGNFYTSAPDLDSIASYSALKIRETTYSASGDYRFKGGFTAGIQYRYATFNDVVENIYDSVNDGRASIVLLTLSKKW